MGWFWAVWVEVVSAGGAEDWESPECSVPPAFSTLSGVSLSTDSQ